MKFSGNGQVLCKLSLPFQAVLSHNLLFKESQLLFVYFTGDFGISMLLASTARRLEK